MQRCILRGERSNVHWHDCIVLGVVDSSEVIGNKRGVIGISLEYYISMNAELNNMPLVRA